MARGGADIARVLQRVLADDPAGCDLTTVRARLDDARRIDAFFAARAAAYRSAYERLMAESAAAPPAARPEPCLPPAPEPDLPSLPPLSTREARRQELRATWLGRCPLFAEALAWGQVQPGARGRVGV